MEAPALMLVGELADVLCGYRDVRCSPEVECEDGVVTLRVSFPVPTLENVNLFHELRHATDVHQMRAIGDRYGIAPEKIEALLNERREG